MTITSNLMFLYIFDRSGLLCAAPPPPPVSPCKRGWWRSPAATAMPSPLAVEAAAAAEALVLATVLQL